MSNTPVKPRVKPEKRMSITANIVCYKAKTLSNGENPLMIRYSFIKKLKMLKLVPQYGTSREYFCNINETQSYSTTK